MAEILRQAFRESGMSLKRLSDDSGTRYASVHAFFTAERDPQLSTVERWCRVLGLILQPEKQRGRRSVWYASVPDSVQGQEREATDSGTVYVEFTDHRDKVRRVPVFTDK